VPAPSPSIRLQHPLHNIVVATNKEIGHSCVELSARAVSRCPAGTTGSRAVHRAAAAGRRTPLQSRPRAVLMNLCDFFRLREIGYPAAAACASSGLASVTRQYPATPADQLPARRRPFIDLLHRNPVSDIITAIKYT
jgi:hypothetical protein